MSAPNRLVVYHTSDLHAARGFGARLAALVEPDALLVDSGDALAGSSVFYVAHEAVIGELEQAPYRALAVGNREFHYLHGCFQARARSLPAPLVCSNLVDLREREPVYSRELIVEAAGVKVRLLALLVPQYRTGSGWEQIFGWRFLAPDVALGELMRNESRDPSPDDPSLHIPTIVLSHLGLPADREIAARWPKLAAILGGHTHDALRQPEMVGAVPVVHPGAHASHVGRLELSVTGGSTHLVSYSLLPLLGTQREEARDRARPGTHV